VVHLVGECRISGPDIVFVSVQELLFIIEVSNASANLNIETGYLLLCLDDLEMLIHGNTYSKMDPCLLTNILAHFLQKVEVHQESKLHNVIPE
jgi:hypothetical protein